MPTPPTGPLPPPEDDPLWFQRAVFYEVSVSYTHLTLPTNREV